MSPSAEAEDEDGGTYFVMSTLPRDLVREFETNPIPDHRDWHATRTEIDTTAFSSAIRTSVPGISRPDPDISRPGMDRRWVWTSSGWRWGDARPSDPLPSMINREAPPNIPPPPTDHPPEGYGPWYWTGIVWAANWEGAGLRQRVAAPPPPSRVPRPPQPPPVEAHYWVWDMSDHLWRLYQRTGGVRTNITAPPPTEAPPLPPPMPTAAPVDDSWRRAHDDHADARRYDDVLVHHQERTESTKQRAVVGALLIPVVVVIASMLVSAARALVEWFAP